jgi:putative colanic acid biosynthesis acetyltransferase WcaF
MNTYYSKKEIVLRIIWGLIDPFLFRYSPRLLYGWRNFLLRLMGARIGKNVKIFPSARITFPWLLEINDHTVISWGVRIYNLGQIKIGENCVISQYAHLCGGTHDISKPGFLLLRTGLTIGNHVWVAADAFVGPRVHVGDYAILGARAVVVKDVQSAHIVAGNPSRTIGLNEHAEIMTEKTI